MSEPGPKFAAGLPLDSELLYRSLFESSVAFVCIHQLDGTLLAVNPAAAQCLGYPAEQAVGHTIAEFMPPESAAGFAEYLAAIQKHGRHSGEMHLRTRSGDVRVWSYSNVVVRPDRGEPYVIGHAVDITERRRAEVDRERLIAELQEALGRVKTLTGLLPICSSCKKIRDDRGQWNHVEAYIRDRSDANFSHGICPDCAHRLYPDHYKK
ncbi:MAG TPA: PAS domain S-box protein [Terriglobales bacterium]|jgi:PAS domain S-box-containing protein|nr:PAS domain S-box protein [Terriglobales bacterium]